MRLVGYEGSSLKYAKTIILNHIRCQIHRYTDPVIATVHIFINNNKRKLIFEIRYHNTMNQLKDLEVCKNAATHHRNLNDVENGICILGNFNRIHRSFCWCDLQNIDVKEPVELSCIICLMYERDSYNALPVPANQTENIEFSDFMDVIFEQELTKINKGAYDITCGLSQKEQNKCMEKFGIIYEKFMKNWE